MINKTDDWYEQAVGQSDIYETQKSNFLKKAVFALALIIAGYSIFEASKQTGLTPEEIEKARSNPYVLNVLEEQDVPIAGLPSSTTEDLPSHGLPTNLNESEIETLIRLHEVSGSKRFVTVKGKQVDIRKVYPDPIHGWSVPTIGIGFNLNRSEAKSLIEAFGLDYGKVRTGQQALTDDQVNILYRQDVQNAIKDAKSFLPNFNDQPSSVKTIVVDMSFNMGLGRLSTFKKFRKALLSFDFQTASKEMQNSNWAEQTKTRASRLIQMMQNVTPKI